jgi:hypothetical protein
MAEDRGLEPRSPKGAGFQDRWITNYPSPPRVAERRILSETAGFSPDFDPIPTARGLILRNTIY